VWTDTCNVYVIKEGEAALLVDLGDGSVLDHLSQIGVRRVDWVLLTHHHREQCQGFPRLGPWNARLAAPEAERELLEHPSNFRKMQVRLGDRYTIHGSSFVRPPIDPVRVDRGFRTMDVFEWEGREFWCVDTRGNSPGGMSYLVKRRGRWLAFTGDLVGAGATMHTWFDSEWDYGFGAGIHALVNAAGQVEGYRPSWVFPSHGPPIPEGAGTLALYQKKLRELESLLLRGYDVQTMSGARQDPISTPSPVPHVWQVLPHLYKFRGPNFYPNFCLILAPNGHALAVDCGLLEEPFLDRSIELMRERLGLRQIDAVIPTHMHGDHFLQAPHLRKKWGAQIWALDRMAPLCEHPERFDYSAPIQAYAQKLDGVLIESVALDRLFKDGDSLDWEGYRFTVDWMPGQTEFALCLTGTIDGRRVAFTGDNIFADPEDPRHTGHEAVVAHNSAILEEGYIQGAEYLSRLRPDLLMGGHSYVMDRPAGLIERYRSWAYRMRDAFRELSAEPDYRIMYDPYWVRAEPYRLKLGRGETAPVDLHLRNFLARSQRHRIEVHAPEGLSVRPGELLGELPARGRGREQVWVSGTPQARAGVHLVALDVTLDDRRYGEWFDFVVEVRP
jgi:glyoxylase-like metal-dependent hydrolase (beta-lactamase superfamily II)